MEVVKATPAFTSQSRYYDFLYPDKNYAAEVEYICGLLDRFGNGGQDLLEFGSGTGQHGRLLGERGYAVEGIERSAAMFAAASQSANFHCRLGDACSIRLDKKFDGVLALFHVLNYQLHDEKVRAFFSNAAFHLRPGGIFLFDTWYSPAVARQRPEVRVKQVATGALNLMRTAEPVSLPGGNRVDVKYTLLVNNHAETLSETLTEIHSMRHFSLPELDAFANTCGFERLLAEEFLTRQDPSEATWGVSVVLRRKE